MPFSSSRVLLFAASMMASSSATLAASAAASCLEGDGACQGSARSLLQSKTKLDLDHLTFILEDKDAMHSSRLISDETVDELQARAEAMVQNGQALSPLERTTLNALNKTLGEMLPTLQDGHSKDQAEIDVAVQLIKNCNKNFDDDAEAAKTAKRQVNTSQNQHEDCRTEQSKLKAEACKASRELDKFWKPLVLPQKPVVASQAFMDSVEEWVKNNKKPLSEKLSKNAKADENLTKKAGDCDSKQSVLESGFCQWFGRATAANKSYARCWSQSGSLFAKLKKEALASAEGRKFQYVAIHKIQCYTKVILLPSRKSLNKCKDLSLDVSIFNLTNTVAEPQKNVAGELGPMDSKPGDESWKQSVYGGLSGVANVTPCAVAHVCGSDERVLAHRCVACGPGKENQAGDDALGPNTNCTAVLPPFNTGNGFAFKFRVSVRFNSWNGENYPVIVGSSTGAFAFHGLGPAYGGIRGKVVFYIQTVNNVGAHGRGGGQVDTATKLTEGVWYNITVEKTADQVCIKVDTDASVCSRRNVTAGEFQMKPVGTLSWGAGSNIEGRDFLDLH